MTDAERTATVRRLYEWGDVLDGCERRRHEINRLKSQLVDADGMLGAQVITGMPRGSGTSDPTARYVQMRDDALRRIDRLVDEINVLIARKAETDSVIATLPENQRALLEMRYVKGWTLTIKIPQVLHVDPRTVYRWHSDALEKMSSNVHFLGV